MVVQHHHIVVPSSILEPYVIYCADVVPPCLAGKRVDQSCILFYLIDLYFPTEEGGDIKGWRCLSEMKSISLKLTSY